MENQFDWRGLMHDMQDMGKHIREEMYAKAKTQQPVFPLINCIETPEGYRYACVLAGYKKEGLLLSWEASLMTLKSHQKEEQAVFLQQEYSIKPFERSINLPENTNPEQLEAKFENGILFVFLPKILPAEQKHVPIV